MNILINLDINIQTNLSNKNIKNIIQKINYILILLIILQ